MNPYLHIPYVARIHLLNAFRGDMKALKTLGAFYDEEGMERHSESVRQNIDWTNEQLDLIEEVL